MGEGLHPLCLLPGSRTLGLLTAPQEDVSFLKDLSVFLIHSPREEPLLERIRVSFGCVNLKISFSKNEKFAKLPHLKPARGVCHVGTLLGSVEDIRECWVRASVFNDLAGVSRSVTLVVAYIMTVTDFGWEDALHTVRAGRSCANPNLGFQRQLQEFEELQVHQFRQWLREEYGESPLRDAEEARSILGKYKERGRAEPPPGARRWAGLRGPPALAPGSYAPEA
ncbi:hypothetical protein FD755_022370 [Muntiacus reevesi]|uniref:Tyrosine-protein phosphatase domain-containing protein n=1 Tax=Muntiacus reevesi TaxID=9886 RepID=A0A5N3W099_MUNRE|nr:hypothetical protein FD755_022370 [Muntiacus reevesi]